MDKWWAVLAVLAVVTAALWGYNIGSMTYTKVSAQTCEGVVPMRYLITGYYANGDEYGDATDSLVELSWILSDIDRFDTEKTPAERRVLSRTIMIETEEN